MPTPTCDQPEELFWEGVLFLAASDKSMEYTEKLLEAARIWRATGDFLAAGIATSVAITSIVKIGLPAVCAEWSRQAIRDYASFLERSKDEPLASLLALMKIYQECYRFLPAPFRDLVEVSRIRCRTAMKLAETLIECFEKDKRGPWFLLEGLRVEGPVPGPWTAKGRHSLTAYTDFDCDKRRVSFRIDAAFQLMIETGDYIGAWRLCTLFQSAFGSPRLRAWREVVKGFVRPEQAHVLFMRAADWFSKVDDAGEFELDDFRVSHTWEPHFRTRAFLASASMDTEHLEDWLSRAGQQAARFKPVLKPGVQRFDLLVRSLAGLLGCDGGIDAARARETLKVGQYFHREEYDPIMLEFIDNAVDGLAKLEKDRRTGLSKIGRALAALERLPILIPPEASAFSIALDRQTIKVLDGVTCSWIHKRLSAIALEDTLRRILLRLFQNQIPDYAHIRHGPFEYGKDIAVAIREDDSNVLRMYQVKCGDISASEWHGGCRPQLEQIFQVPMSEFQIPFPVDRRIGVLIWNGHLSPHLEPIVQAWQAEQLQKAGREYHFLNLDGIVNYIIDSRSVSVLRLALDEVGSG